MPSVKSVDMTEKGLLQIILKPQNALLQLGSRKVNILLTPGTDFHDVLPKVREVLADRTGASANLRAIPTTDEAKLLDGMVPMTPIYLDRNKLGFLDLQTCQASYLALPVEPKLLEDLKISHRQGMSKIIWYRPVQGRFGSLAQDQP